VCATTEFLGYDPASSTSSRNNIRAVLAADAPGCIDFRLPQ